MERRPFLPIIMLLLGYHIMYLVGMYPSVKYSLKLEGGTTLFFSSFVEVKQEYNLSPTLFNIFVNNITSVDNNM